jgi:hypothetical protein
VEVEVEVESTDGCKVVEQRSAFFLCSDLGSENLMHFGVHSIAIGLSISECGQQSLPLLLSRSKAVTKPLSRFEILRLAGLFQLLLKIGVIDGRKIEVVRRRPSPGN